MRWQGLLLSVFATVSLAGCMGDDSSDSMPPGGPVVTAIDVGSPRYRTAWTFAIVGTGLDSDVAVTTSGCEQPTLSKEAPFVSTDAVAYYQCPRLVNVGLGQVIVTRASDGTPLRSAQFTVPLPEVTLSVGNGLGVFGDVVVRLRADLKPATVDNFLGYVESGFYAGTIFHYVFPDLGIQGGGFLPYAPDETRVPRPTRPPIDVENDRWNHLSNLKWTVAAAQTSLFASTSQIWINLQDNVFLDDLGSGNALVVFGSIIEGTDVVAAIAAAPCVFTRYDAAPGCLPLPNVVITAARQTR